MSGPINFFELLQQQQLTFVTDMATSYNRLVDENCTLRTRIHELELEIVKRGCPHDGCPTERRMPSAAPQPASGGG